MLGKIKILLLPAFALLSLCMCTHKELAPAESGNGGSAPVVQGDCPEGFVRLALSDTIVTRTANNGTTVSWSEGDIIKVNGEDYDVVIPSDGTPYVEVKKSDSYEAFFPAQIWDDGNLWLQPAQFWQDGSFGAAANPMYAESSGGSLAFSHLLGILKLTVKGTDEIASISITDNASESLCGLYSFSSGSVSPTGDLHYSQVVLNCKTEGADKGVTLSSSGTDFYITLPARTYEAGLTICISGVDGHSMTLESSTPRTITKGAILSTPAINYAYDADQFYAYHFDNLVFGADPVAGKQGFQVDNPSSPGGYELLHGVTDSATEPGTAVINNANSAGFSIGKNYAYSRNLYSFNCLYRAQEFHGYLGMGANGLSKSTLKLPALRVPDGAVCKAELNFRMAFQEGNEPSMGIQIFGEYATTGKNLEFWIDGNRITSAGVDMADTLRWTSGAVTGDGNPTLNSGVCSVEALLIKPSDLKDNKWHKVKILIGSVTDGTVIRLTPFMEGDFNTPNQSWFIDDIEVKRIEYDAGAGHLTVREPSLTSYSWTKGKDALQPSLLINPSHTKSLNFLANQHESYGIKYIDLNVNVGLLYKTWNVYADDEEGWSEADAAIAAVKERLDAMGVKVWHIHLPYAGYKEGYVEDSNSFEFAHPKEDVRNAAVNRTMNIMTHLSVLEPCYYMIHANQHYTWDFDGYESSGMLWWETKTYYKEEAVKSYKTLVAHAATLNDGSGKLLIENIANVGATSSSFSASAAHLKWFCQQCPGLGICLDFSHAVVNGINDPATMITELGSYIKAVHVHGNNTANDRDFHLIPGYSGGLYQVPPYSTVDNLDWGAIYSALIATGYRGPFTYELEAYARDCIPSFNNVAHNYYSVVLPSYISSLDLDPLNPAVGQEDFGSIGYFDW